ncbi:MAG: hypothetical protein K0S39_430 [Paenibacillus sp.]|jgi:hypothetical protein|nr:hypothetical protein [Paenibacillus sp.]
MNSKVITSHLLAKIAGYILVVIGTLHLLLGIIGDFNTTPERWTTIARTGFWNTIVPPWINEYIPLQLTFWTQPGSFAIPLSILGCLIVWNAAKRQALPSFLGWLLLVFALITCIMAPVGGFWPNLLAAILIIIHTNRQKQNEQH